jgi:hypothetical protein
MCSHDWEGCEGVKMYLFAWKLGDDAAAAARSRRGEDGSNNRSWYSSVACRRSDVLMP